jgi:CheY-like chemotaxis protein
MLHRGRKILIVDDEAYVISIVSSRFRKLGDEVLTALDGLEALEVARRDPPDLIISDFQMPVLSGLELARRLKSEATLVHIPILLLTARGHRLAADELEQTNIRVILPKPFSTKELVAKAEQLLATSPGRSAVGDVA